MDTIRILIADDQTITRSGLRNLLESVPGFEIVGEAGSGAEAIQMAAASQPDVILMDLRMPEVNGIEASRQIHRMDPHVGILVITIFEDDASVFPAIRAGARGYLLKDADGGELARAVHTVAGGGVIFSPGIASRVLQYLSSLSVADAGVSRDIPSQPFDELTNREREIL